MSKHSKQPKRPAVVINLDADPQNANWLRRPGGVLPPKPKPGIARDVTPERSSTAMATFTDAPWDGAASNYASTADYCNACLLNENDGPSSGWVQSKCHLPVKTPSGAYSKGAIRNALARIDQVQSGGKAAARARLHALAKEAKIG